MIQKGRYKHRFWEQTVEPGTQTIKIGFGRDFVKVVDKLRVRTTDTVIFEDVPSIPPSSTLSLRGIKHLVIHNIGLLNNGSIFGMDDLETLEITGTIGRIESGFVCYCSNLHSVSINANIFSTEEYLVISGCNNLSSFTIQGVLPKHLIHITDDYNTYFKNFKVEGKSKYPFDNYALTLQDKSDEELEKIKTGLLDTSKWVNKFFGHDKFIDFAIADGASYIWGVIIRAFNSWSRAYKLRKIIREYGNQRTNPTVKTLKLSGPYQPDEKPLDIHFEYASPSRAIFESYRRHFHLWKIAGKGTDIDKMIRLCRWVHEKIKHKGDAIPNTGLNLLSLMMATSYKNEPGNCFVQSICLTEALLSIGIKAKYIKGFRLRDDANLYHVFVAAWSRKKRKWIFLDPTYGAYVKDADGNILSPSEIRHNLINDVPMTLNEEADYNGDKGPVKTYFNEFLAQYLYYMTANTISQDSTEGWSGHVQGEWVNLIPVERYTRYLPGVKTTDEALFWQAPE